jgi:pimeloyl-ACP methyl ester carboxylesterase
MPEEDTVLGPVRRVVANGLDFAYHELGEGPLVLCLHGYPDTAHCWADLLPRLAAAGFRGVAPYLRGYAPTAIPEDGDYSGWALGRDVLGLIEALGEDAAHLIGHDWGALAIHSAYGQVPERVLSFTTLAIPHPRTLKLGPRLLWKSRHFVTYQFRKRAVRGLKRDDFSHLEAIYRRWSPAWEDPSQHLETVKRSFREPGVPEAALAYYWAARADARNRDLQRAIRRRVHVPALALAGDRDGALVPSMYEATTEAYEGPYRWAFIEGTGHFLQSEAPERVSDEILGFLTALPRQD